MAADTQGNGYLGQHNEGPEDWEFGYQSLPNNLLDFDHDTNIPTSYIPNLFPGQVNRPLLDGHSALTLDNFLQSGNEGQGQFPATESTGGSDLVLRYVGSEVVQYTEDWNSSEQMAGRGEDLYRGEPVPYGVFENGGANTSESHNGAQVPAVPEEARAAQTLASLNGQMAWGGFSMQRPLVPHTENHQMLNRALFDNGQASAPYAPLTASTQANAMPSPTPGPYSREPHLNATSRNMHIASNVHPQGFTQDMHNATNGFLQNSRRHLGVPSFPNDRTGLHEQSRPLPSRTNSQPAASSVGFPLFDTDTSFNDGGFYSNEQDPSHEKEKNLMGVFADQQRAESTRARNPAHAYQQQYDIGQQPMPNTRSLPFSPARAPESHNYLTHDPFARRPDPYQYQPQPYQHHPQPRHSMSDMAHSNNNKRSFDEANKEGQHHGSGPTAPSPHGLGISNQGDSTPKRAKTAINAVSSLGTHPNVTNAPARGHAGRQGTASGNTTPSSGGSPANATQPSTRKRKSPRVPLTKHEKKLNHIKSERYRRQKATDAYNTLSLLVPRLRPDQPKVPRADQVRQINLYLESLQGGNSKFLAGLGIDPDDYDPEESEDGDDDDQDGGGGTDGGCNGGAYHPPSRRYDQDGDGSGGAPHRGPPPVPLFPKT